MTRKLFDPVHFFGSDGAPVLTLKHLEAENTKLRTENSKLKAMLKRIAKQRAEQAEADAPITLN